MPALQLMYYAATTLQLESISSLTQEKRSLPPIHHYRFSHKNLLCKEISMLKYEALKMEIIFGNVISVTH